VLGSSSVVPRTLISARLIGLIRINDQRQVDDKVLCVPVGDPELDSYQQVEELPPHKLAVLRRLFEDYKAPEDKEVVVEDILPAEAALRVVEKCVAAYRKQFLAGYS
jgi:inorganic pyrophosphatase